MTDSFVAVPLDSTGKKLRTDYSLSSGGTVVHTEYVRADHSVIVSPTAASFNVTVSGLTSAIRNVTSNTAASFNVTATITSARVDHSLVVSPTAGSFNVTVSGLTSAIRNVTSNTAASFNVTVANPSGSGLRNVTSNTAASFNTTTLLPGYARIQGATAASTLVTAKSLSLTAGSFNATVFAPGYVRAQNPTTYASFLTQGSIPGYVRVTSNTAASFNVTATITSARVDHSLVVSPTAASFNARVDHSTVNATNSSFAVSVPGVIRVTNLTAASFLVTSTGGSGFRNVTSNTAASFNVRSDHSSVLSPTQASFLVSHPGVLRVTNLTAASFLVTSTGGSGFRNVTSNTAASFLVTAKSISLTAGSFLAQVSVPAFVNVKGPTTRGSTVVQADHSLVVATNSSFSVSIPGILRQVTTRGSAVLQTDHSLVVSTTAGSFLASVVNVATARSTWPTAEANNATSSTFITDLSRRLVVMPYAFPEKTFSTSILVSSTIPIVAVAAVAGERAYITYLGGANSSGTATQVDVNMTQVTAGRNLFDSWIAASGGGFSAPQPFPIRGNTNASVVVRVTPTVSRVQFTIVGYTAP